jgi:hypothetical protein
MLLAAPAHSVELLGSLDGQAYGLAASGKIGPVAHDLGRVANIGLDCVGTNGDVVSRQVQSFEAGSGGEFARGDGVRSTVSGDQSARRATAQNTSEVNGLNLLNGLITANKIRAVANVIATPDDIRTTAEGSRFESLRIAGNPITDDVSPNTQIEVPGLGTAVLKWTRRTDSGNKANIVVEMLRINVAEDNSYDLPVGALIVVGHARGGFGRTRLDRIVSGRAFVADASAVTNGDNNRIDKQAPVGIPCVGTGGDIRTNTANAIEFGPLLRSGGGESTAFGGVTRSGLIAKTSATAGAVRLANGLIRAREVTAVAKDSFRNGVRMSSTAGTQVSGLQIGGLSHGTVTAQNVKIDVPGIGHLIVNQVVIPDPGSRDPTIANGLNFVVTRHNALGLPVGARFVIAHADSMVDGTPPGGQASASAR